MREELWGRGEYHGYVLYDGTTPIGWCRVGPTSTWRKLCRQFGLVPDDAVHAFTSFGMRPEARGRGCVHHLLRSVLHDLGRAGVEEFMAFPRRLEGRAAPGEVWTGPLAIFQQAGFGIVGSTERHHIVRLHRRTNGKIPA